MNNNSHRKNSHLIILIRRSIDFHNEFKDFYNKIIKDFKFDSQKDIFARDYLSSIILQKKNWNLDAILSSFHNFLKTKKILLVYGCGVSLEITVNFLLKNNVNLNDDKICNIAADGASRLLKEKKIRIGALFSDLDGITRNEFIYPNFVIVHAHGDNIDKIKEFEKDILDFNKIIFTCQVEPKSDIINPGGFTDGDRILFFLRSFLIPNQQIYLIGMDFMGIVGKYSKPQYQKNYKASEIKQKKLKYAAFLFDWLDKFIKNDIYYINSQKPSQAYKNLELQQFLKKMNQE